MTKKICFLVEELGNGGSERVVSILANNFHNLGYKVSIIMVQGTRIEYNLKNEIEIICLQKVKISKIKLIRKIRGTIKDIDPDVIISFDVYTNVYSIISTFFMGKKLIISERNDPYQYPAKKIRRKIRDTLYLFADGIVFQTKDAMNYFNARIRNKGIVIYNPITPNLPEWKQNKNKTIISVSRLAEQKNHQLLINTFSKLDEKYRNYKVHIYGRGPQKEELESLIVRKGLTKQVYLMGYSNDIHQEMANCALFVITSNFEGMSNSMLEALAIGIPVISTDSPIGGARMMIEHMENGLLINVNDENELKLAIESVLDNETFARKLSENSKKLRSKLNEETIAKEWEKFILTN